MATQQIPANDFNDDYEQSDIEYHTSYYHNHDYFTIGTVTVEKSDILDMLSAELKGDIIDFVANPKSPLINLLTLRLRIEKEEDELVQAAINEALETASISQ